MNATSTKLPTFRTPDHFTKATHGKYATWRAGIANGSEIRLLVNGHRGGSGCGVGGWGPDDLNRIVDGGPLVAGPHAYAFNLCTVIDNHGGTGAKMDREREAGLLIEVNEGDTIEAEGYTYRVQFLPNRRNEYVELVLVS